MMETTIKWGVAVLAAALLSGCENDVASFIVEDKDHALTLIREQHYFWSDDTDLALVVARLPDCQRRHPMASAPLPEAQVSIYELSPSRYQVRQGERWYLADTGGCTLQTLPSAPSPIGKLLGTFERKDARLRFIPK